MLSSDNTFASARPPSRASQASRTSSQPPLPMTAPPETPKRPSAPALNRAISTRKTPSKTSGKHSLPISSKKFPSASRSPGTGPLTPSAVANSPSRHSPKSTYKTSPSPKPKAHNHKGGATQVDGSILNLLGSPTSRKTKQKTTKVSLLRMLQQSRRFLSIQC
ncbi:hypothetical protein M427DRAFT_230735 [Gonapodya prolifera JEL478]|uniref:Uncharacterized protein n=1 Tax=Gonapodya prolifera (strain JEL478) TaxID=1344416 RepID=A0A138ZY34_GONPJ|nr:hypothetical protein M427DRAFT_230735 [Gonapodya prolifera JEL478]|eukprot:KXS09400.1 hypothetical protein M427DRAFT_230735 [Gonapodya prolifera JEL478]